MSIYAVLTSIYIALHKVKWIRLIVVELYETSGQIFMEQWRHHRGLQSDGVQTSLPAVTCGGHNKISLCRSVDLFWRIWARAGLELNFYGAV